MPISIMSKEPSIVQASDAETAHREHESPQHSHQQSEHKKSTRHSHAQHHRLHHRKLRGRQAVSIPPSDIPEAIAPPEVTEVVQTISVIQQVNVDEGGSTVGYTTYTDVSAEPTSTAVDVGVSQSPMPSSASDGLMSSDPATLPHDLPTETGSVISTATTDALPITTELPASELPTSVVSTEVPASELPTSEVSTEVSTTELPATELTASKLLTELPPAKFITQDPLASQSSNSTTVTSSSSYTTFLSSTKSPSSSNSRSATTIPSGSSIISAASIDSLLSLLSSTIAVSATDSLTLIAESGSASIETTSASSATFADGSYASASDEASPSATETVGLVGGAGAIGEPNSSDSNDSGSNDSNSGSSSPLAIDTPPKVAGVVVGSLAAVAILLVVAFYILKRIKQNKGGAVRLSTGSQQLRLAGGGTGAPMTERHSGFLPIFSAFRSRPKQIAGGASEAGGSEEQSFVRISGRKLPSVLQHGGDGYGEPGEFPPIPQHLSQQLNDASFYQDDTGYHGGIGDKNTGVSSAVASGGLVAGAAATQRDRSPGRNPAVVVSRSSPSAHQPNTPFRGLHEYQDPFSSLSDPMSSPHDASISPNKPMYREGPMRNATVVPTPPQRSQSQHLMISSGLSASPEHGSIKEETASQLSVGQSSPAQRHSENTESSDSTNYTDAREFDSLDRMVLRKPDALGRSHQDGSKGSRFREDV